VESRLFSAVRANFNHRFDWLGVDRLVDKVFRAQLLNPCLCLKAIIKQCSGFTDHPVKVLLRAKQVFAASVKLLVTYQRPNCPVADSSRFSCVS
jgi:hypothetical protein